MEQYQIFKRKINYYETDKMQVVHHSNYIRYLEECRMDFLRQMHLDYETMESNGIMIPVLSVSCNYKSPARFGDTICIIPKLEKFHSVKFEISYEVFSEDLQILHNQASSEHCFVDFNFKPVHLKRDYSEIYQTMQQFVGVDLMGNVEMD